MMLNKINSFFILFRTYILLLIGILCLSFLLYFRFIRERVPQHIPMIMTEYRFWMLFYICLLYFYIVIALLRSRSSNSVTKEIIKTLYVPLITLDHLIKYNRFVKPKYYSIINNLIFYLELLNNKNLIVITALFQIFPRIILVIALSVDTFYFCKLTLLYKFILIGLIPFIHKYIIYCLKDIVEEYMKDLLLIYRNEIHMIDNAYANPKIRWKKGEHNKYHDEYISLKEFVEFRTKQILYKTPEVDYHHSPLLLDKFAEEYAQNKYNKKDFIFTEEDYKITDNFYYRTMEKILQISVFVEKYQNLDNKTIIKYTRVLIFLLYFICWSFILIISYYFCPIDFVMTKYFIYNLASYLNRLDDIFSGLNQSISQVNFLTKDIINNIWQRIKNIFSNE